MKSIRVNLKDLQEKNDGKVTFVSKDWITDVFLKTEEGDLFIAIIVSADLGKFAVTEYHQHFQEFKDYCDSQGIQYESYDNGLPKNTHQAAVIDLVDLLNNKEAMTVLTFKKDYDFLFGIYRDDNLVGYVEYPEEYESLCIKEYSFNHDSFLRLLDFIKKFDSKNFQLHTTIVKEENKSQPDN